MHVMLKLVKALPKASMPLAPAVAVVKVWSYRVTGNGRVIGTPQSSQLMPMLVVPGTNVPVPEVYTYEDEGVQVGVGVGVGVPPVLTLPYTPIEKSAHWFTLGSQVDAKAGPNRFGLSQKEFRLLPQGVPTQ